MQAGHGDVTVWRRKDLLCMPDDLGKNTHTQNM